MAPGGINIVSCVWLLALLATVGCNKSNSPPLPLSVEQLPAAMEKAFAKAKPELKDLAAQVVSSVQTNAYAKAYQELQSLSSVPDMTREQFSVIGRAMITVNLLLQSAAAKGDENAAEAVKVYRSQK